MKQGSRKAHREEQLLRQGKTFIEVAALTGEARRSILRRNREWYGVDVQAAFGSRVKQEGVPCKLKVSDSFGYWFAGLFDGEGSFLAHLAEHKTFVNCCLAVQIKLRADDAAVLREVHKSLGGHLYKGQRKDAHSYFTWHMDTIKELAEVILPLFDRYALHTKKRKEFLLWRRLVLDRYVSTLAGTTRYQRSKAERRLFIRTSKQLHQWRRRPKIPWGLYKGASVPALLRQRRSLAEAARITTAQSSRLKFELES